MKPEDIVIHIDWSGPHSLDEVAHFRQPWDWGIYQFYGGHPIYGSGVLLYIGKTESGDGGGFAGRVPKSAGRCSHNQDGDIEVHVGRLIGTTPGNEEWERRIGLAERLLIYAHKPPFNRKLELNTADKDLFQVHVLNWRHHRRLLPEVSGSRWTDRFDVVPYGSYFGKPLNNEQMPNTALEPTPTAP